jgi:hypothetical protein
MANVWAIQVIRYKQCGIKTESKILGVHKLNHAGNGEFES